VEHNVVVVRIEVMAVGEPLSGAEMHLDIPDVGRVPDADAGLAEVRTAVMVLESGGENDDAPPVGGGEARLIEQLVKPEEPELLL
jgi:hypothetical protein